MSALPIEDLLPHTGRRDATVIPFPGGVVVVPAGPARSGKPSRVRSHRMDLRITRRGRLLLTSLVLAAVLGLATTLAAGSALAGSGSAPEPTRTVVVLPGQTLHEVAATVPGGGDVRDVAAVIRDVNGLEFSALVAGQQLRVPLTTD